MTLEKKGLIQYCWNSIAALMQDDKRCDLSTVDWSLFSPSSPAGQIEGSRVAKEEHMVPLGHITQCAAPGAGL